MIQSIITLNTNLIAQPITISIKAEEMSTSSLFEVACIFYSQKQYECAMKLFLQAAENGDANAHLKIGDMFKHGNGVASDYLQAESWYKKAVKLGNISAKVCLGQLCEMGYGGIERNYHKARRWYLDAAEDNDDEAAYRLGNMYLYDRGEGKKPSKACIWFERAANLGNVEGAYHAGSMYERGDVGVPNNPSKARTFLQRAADKGHINAKRMLTKLRY